VHRCKVAHIEGVGEWLLREDWLSATSPFEKSLKWATASGVSADLAADGFNASSRISSNEEVRHHLTQLRQARKLAKIVASHTVLDYSSPMTGATLWTPEVVLRFVHANGFLNMQSSVTKAALISDAVSLDADVDNTSSSVLPKRTMHGMLGQTIRYRRFNNQWRFLEGMPDDYSVTHAFDTHFNFELFKQF